MLRRLPQALANNTCSGTQPFGLRLRDQRSLTMGKKRSPPKLVLKKVTVYRSQDNELSIQLYPNILREPKGNQIDKISFRTEDLRKFFPKSYSAARIQETILKLLSDYQKKRQRSREER